MIFKVNDTPNYNIQMELNINYTEEIITVEITEWNKRKHESTTKSFPAEDFASALRHYESLELRMENEK